MKTKILLVDDEADMLEMMIYNLRTVDYELFTATNGLEALNKARTLLPDLIVLDLMLDGIDGFSLCEILRAQPSTRPIPILVVTALSGQIARSNALEVGANDFLHKPFKPRDLLARIREMLAVRSGLQRAPETSLPSVA